jgi:flagellar basal body P-ring formation protein FlgA
MAWHLLCTAYLSEIRRMRIPQHFWSLSLLMLANALGAGANATEFESLAVIQATAEQHVRSILPKSSDKMYVTANGLDNRLRLAVCMQPLEVFLPSGASLGSRVTVGVRCTQDTQWTIYLPLTIESEVPTLILNKALARNTVATAQDVTTQVRRVSGLGSNAIRSAAELAGQRLKRDLPAGTVLTPAMLQPEILIRRGQQVTVIAMVAGIEVRTQAVALADGCASSRIRVKNLNSAKVVEGLVDSNHVVRVDL